MSAEPAGIRNSTDREGSFSAFYEEELTGQIRAATLILGDRATALDVVHDGFEQVYEAWDRIDSPGPYLQICVLNRCRDLMRRRGVALRKRHLLVPGEVPEVDVPLFDALSRLPFNHRAAVVLRFYLQLTEAEIAERLGCATGSVGPWIRRGLDRLGEELRPPQEQEQ